MSEIDIQATIADHLVAYANQIAADNPDADYWNIADGILSGAIHWWLYANAPCGNPQCEDCESIRNAEQRMITLNRLVTDMAQTSDYYHSPNDDDVAHA